MNEIYLLAFTCVFYACFGSIVDLLIGKSAPGTLLRIRTKVIFHTFIAPVMFSAVLFIVLRRQDTVNANHYYTNLVLAVLLIFSAVWKILSIKRKYLTYFKVEGTSLNIKYLSPHLKTETIIFPISDVNWVETTRANWLLEYPGELNVKTNRQWSTFQLIDKAFTIQTRTAIESMNLRMEDSIER